MSKTKLIAFEKKADSLASKLSLLTWDADNLFSHIFNAIYHLIDSNMEREAGDLCCRLSHLPRLLEQQGKTSPMTVDASQLAKDWNNLFQYLHFCDLMPQVHKGYFHVDGDESVGFHLRHKGGDLSNYEIRDILLADLARPFYVDSSTHLQASIDHILNSDPHSFNFPSHLIEERMSFCQNSLYDLLEIPDAVYQEMFGVNRQEFNRFRYFMFAFSDFQEAIRSGVKRKFPPSAVINVQSKMIQQVSFLYLPNQNLLNQIKKYTGLNKHKSHSLIRLFSLDFRTSSRWKKDRNKHAGDGYFPPILRIDNGYSLSPRAVKSFLSIRNALFAFQKKELKKFNNVVSKSFEPSLIASIIDALSSFGNIEIRENKIWESSSTRGEIDLLVYSPSLNKALVFQVKAVVPPQGARMVKNVQGRISEAVRQIERFKQLPTEEKERIISDSVGYSVSKIEITDVILSSSCLGSVDTWLKIEEENICGINYPLLKLLIYESLKDGNADLLFNVAKWMKETLDELIVDSKIHWEDKEFDLFGTPIQFPTWSLDDKSLRKIRLKIVSGNEA